MTRPVTWSGRNGNCCRVREVYLRLFGDLVGRSTTKNIEVTAALLLLRDPVVTALALQLLAQSRRFCQAARTGTEGRDFR